MSEKVGRVPRLNREPATRTPCRVQATCKPTDGTAQSSRANEPATQTHSRRPRSKRNDRRSTACGASDDRRPAGDRGRRRTVAPCEGRRRRFRTRTTTTDGRPQTDGLQTDADGRTDAGRIPDGRTDLKLTDLLSGHRVSPSTFSSHQASKEGGRASACGAHQLIYS